MIKADVVFQPVASYPMAIWSFYSVDETVGGGKMRLRISGVIPPVVLHAFMVCTGTN